MSVDAGPSGPVNQQGASGTTIAVTGRVDGNVIVYGEFARFRIEQLPSPVHVSRELPPSQLLRAANEVVPFDKPSRRADLDELQRWFDGSQRRKALLLHGPGGQGKTRLAAYFAARCAEAGWLTVHARHFGDSMVGAALGAEHATSARGILLVLDYAERWPTDDQSLVLNHYVHRQNMPVRILALARSATSWWARFAAAARRSAALPRLGR